MTLPTETRPVQTLVDRLRSRAYDLYDGPLLDEAADEIERLTTENARLRAEVGFRVGRNAPDTSRAIAPKVRTGTIQHDILAHLAWRDRTPIAARGATDWNLETALHRSHQSVSAARNTLVRKGLLVDSGKRRDTGYGNAAIVWVLTEDGRRWADGHA